MATVCKTSLGACSPQKGHRGELAAPSRSHLAQFLAPARESYCVAHGTQFGHSFGVNLGSIWAQDSCPTWPNSWSQNWGHIWYPLLGTPLYIIREGAPKVGSYLVPVLGTGVERIWNKIQANMSCFVGPCSGLHSMELVQLLGLQSPPSEDHPPCQHRRDQCVLVAGVWQRHHCVWAS